MKAFKLIVALLLVCGLMAQEDSHIMHMSEVVSKYTPIMSFGNFIGVGHNTALGCDALKDAIELSEIKYFSCDEGAGCSKLSLQSEVNEYRHLFATNECQLN